MNEDVSPCNMIPVKMVGDKCPVSTSKSLSNIGQSEKVFLAIAFSSECMGGMTSRLESNNLSGLTEISESHFSKAIIGSSKTPLAHSIQTVMLSL